MQLEYFTYYIITTFGQTATTFASQNHAAGVRILCILLFEPLCNLYEIPAGVLRGSGHALYPALGICAFRIGWICTVFWADCTLPTLYRAFSLMAPDNPAVDGSFLVLHRLDQQRSPALLQE